ncbi:DUF1540 domain-containing protein [Demequina sp. SO4-13]|uniref:DUF1540 domain-containing protein n=1 Tax=Demequina sp. SO4-13 TaxID=3401027 RepID=UPI003AF700C6
MPTMIGLPIVSSCSVESCGYNHDGCHASAISVGAARGNENSACNTYAVTDAKGGNADVAAVGACSRTDCVHNEELSCTAEAIEVGASFDEADCLTFAARA